MMPLWCWKYRPPSGGGNETLQAALQGTREVGFTVISMSLSLVAVFLPLLLMGGLPDDYYENSPLPSRWRLAFRWWSRSR